MFLTRKPLSDQGVSPGWTGPSHRGFLITILSSEDSRWPSYYVRRGDNSWFHLIKQTLLIRWFVARRKKRRKFSIREISSGFGCQMNIADLPWRTNTLTNCFRFHHQDNAMLFTLFQKRIPSNVSECLVLLITHGLREQKSVVIFYHFIKGVKSWGEKNPNEKQTENAALFFGRVIMRDEGTQTTARIWHSLITTHAISTPLR